MQLHWKTKVLASSLAALLGTSCVYAIPRGPCDQPPEICCEEPKPGPFAFSYPKDMALSCPRDFYFFGDLLVMQAKEDGLEYAINDTNGAGFPVTGGTVQGFSTEHRDWDWDLGFRIGLGFYLNHDAWNLDARWTYYQVTNDKGSSVKPPSVMIPIWAPPNMTMSSQNVEHSARWEMTLNSLDLRMGKPYHTSRYLILHPHFGIRAAWIEQDYTARIGGPIAGVNTNPIGMDMTAKNDFWGVGSRAGLDTEWILGAGWHLFGNIAVSMMFGKFDISQKTSVSDDSRGYEIDTEFFQNVPNMEIVLGLAWGTYFSQNRYHFGIQAAYEFHQWWDQNRLRRFFDANSTISNDTVSRGDLTLNGASFKFIFNF